VGGGGAFRFTSSLFSFTYDLRLHPREQRQTDGREPALRDQCLRQPPRAAHRRLDRGNHQRHQGLRQAGTRRAAAPRGARRHHHLQRTFAPGAQSLHDHGDSQSLYDQGVPRVDDQRQLSAGRGHPEQGAGLCFRALGRDRAQPHQSAHPRSPGAPPCRGRGAGPPAGATHGAREAQALCQAPTHCRPPSRRAHQETHRANLSLRPQHAGALPGRCAFCGDRALWPACCRCLH